jgi:hypothetical protein
VKEDDRVQISDVEREVIGFLDMWLVLEKSVEALPDSATIEVGMGRPMQRSSIRFPGFNRREEPLHFYIAFYVISQIDAYHVFRGRGHDYERSVVDGMRRMLKIFELLAPKPEGDAKLDAFDLGRILKEIVHPDCRPDPAELKTPQSTVH